MKVTANEMLGYSDLVVVDEKVVDTGRFRMSIYTGRNLVADVVIEAGSADALRNTILSAKNLIAWAEEQLNLKVSKDASVAPAAE